MGDFVKFMYANYDYMNNNLQNNPEFYSGVMDYLGETKQNIYRHFHPKETKVCLKHKECPICRENMKGKKYIILECKHEYCESCYDKSLRTGNSTCCFCREEIPYSLVYK